jgi:SAM-dependent methyltransferase
MSDPGAFWDEKFAPEDYQYGTRPNAFLAAEAWRLNPSSQILAIGDGEGRNGVWLAEQGHRVTTVDVSPRALQKASKLALDRGVRITTICADLRDFDFPVDTYDAAVAVFVHFRPGDRQRVHAGLAHALKPGGLIILEGFTPDQLKHASGGPPVEEMLYTPDMLRADFDGLEVLHCEAGDTWLKEGPLHQGQAATVRFIARKPED